MKIGIIKKSNRCFIELPPEFTAVDSLEFFRLRDGYYLLSVSLGEREAKASEEKPVEKQKISESIQILDDAEKNVLKKLLAIKFQNRTAENVEKALSSNEKKVLEELERKNFINVFRGRKYPMGVYNINDKIYSALYGRETITAQTQQKTAAVQKPAVVQRPGTAQKPSVQKQQIQPSQQSKDALTLGYLIGSGADLNYIIEKHRDEIKSGKIKGLRGFDGRFYIARMDYVSKMSPLIIKQLDKERTIEEIAENLKVEPDAVRTVLHILAEAGDVIEKRKGVYAAI